MRWLAHADRMGLVLALAIAVWTTGGCGGDQAEKPCIVSIDGADHDICRPGGPALVCTTEDDEESKCVRMRCSGRTDEILCARDSARAAERLTDTTCNWEEDGRVHCLGVSCADGSEARTCLLDCAVVGLDDARCAHLECEGAPRVICRRDGVAVGTEELSNTTCEVVDSGVGCTHLSCEDSAASLCEGVDCTVSALTDGGCARVSCEEGARTTVCADSDAATVGASLGAKACATAFPASGCVEVRCGEATAGLCGGRDCSAEERGACAEVLCDGRREASICGGDRLTREGDFDDTSCSWRDSGSCSDIRCRDGSSARACGIRDCSVGQHAAGCVSLACGEDPPVTACSPSGAREVVAATTCQLREDASCAAIDCEDGSSARLCPQALPAIDVAKLVRQAVRFYGAQRSGSSDNWLLGGQACHEADGESIGRDLSGGWHDAGDHLKLSLTIAYATYALFKAHDAFPSAFGDDYGPSYGAPNGIADVIDEASVGARYLMKLIEPDGDRIVTRVGDGSDHAMWVTCLGQETLPASLGGPPRPVRLGTNPDVSALAAAALAVGSRVIAAQDPATAAAWLEQAERLYAFAQAHAAQPGYNDEFYRNDQTLDDRLAGAAELWATTGDEALLDDALALDNQLGRHFWVLSWNQTADLARHTLAKRGHLSHGYDVRGNLVPNWRADLDGTLAKRDEAGVARLDDWGLLRYALGAAFSAGLYFDAFGGEEYRDFALQQLAYATGLNDRGYSFVIGFGDVYPRFPHHRNAYGVDTNPDDGTKNSVPPLHLLEGALVGGTSPPESFEDRLTDYKTSEVSIDFNAALVGAAAFMRSLRDDP